MRLPLPRRRPPAAGDLLAPPTARAQPDARERRAAIRRFVLDHHPDHGGDAEFFAAGLRALRAGGPLPGHTEIWVHHRRAGLGVALDWAQRRWAHSRRPPRVH